ncbi:MAG: 2-phospho-L-lactate transferase [Candidatus Heimdallarchaeota archaeon]|nr:MAG: 2-phospho-L-lactate transferase [Candidatus Heimdallarchaeota archaeon]
MSESKVVFLSGGTGTPKLLQGAVRVIDTQNITVIGNTGDDWNFYGLYVSPDIDSVILILADLLDTKKWWGIKEDTFRLVDFLKNQLKEDVWFNLGDYDAGLCLFRSNLLKQGKNLTEATEIIRKRLDIQPSILPMANQLIQTKIRTSEQTMHLQEYWVRYKGEPHVTNVFYDGDLRKTTPQVLDAIEKANVIIIGPSNPISSTGPILAISPIREALRKASGYRIAISPIIGTDAVSGPTAAFLKAWGREISPVTIAELFHDILDALMIHRTDNQYQNEIQKRGVTPIIDDIYINSETDASRLIEQILERK